MIGRCDLANLAEGDGVVGQKRLKAGLVGGGHGDEETAEGFAEQQAVVVHHPIRRNASEADLRPEPSRQGHFGRRHGQPPLGTIMHGRDQPLPNGLMDGAIHG